MLRAVSVAALLLGAGACAAAAQSDPAPERRSVLEGVYGAEQADRGENLFRDVCSACHAASNFHGAIFQRAWNGRAVYWLFDVLRNTMPQDNPGGLAPDEYVAVIAYILELNGYPPGDAELPTKDAELRRIHIEVKPDSAR